MMGNGVVVAAFVVTMLDSLINYFSMHVGRIVPTNAIVPLLLAVGILRRRLAGRVLPPYYWFALAIWMFGTSLSVLTVANQTPYRLLEIVGGVVAFLVGYFAVYLEESDKKIATYSVLVAWLYAATCLVALLGLAPVYFPMKVGLWSLNGVIIERPEVTTDQNFQVFYLLPIAAILCWRHTRYQAVISFAGSLLALFVLARIQTRSGVLVFLAISIIAAVAPIRLKGMGIPRSLMLSATALVALIYSGKWLNQFTPEMMARFFSTDYATGMGRVESCQYVLEKLADSKYWIAGGNAEFMARAGSVPHCNVTASLLEGGLFGLVSWFLLFALPLSKAWILFLRRKLLDSEAFVLMMGTGMFVLQFSLNIPFVDQVWLWGGAIAAVNVMVSRREVSQMNMLPTAKFNFMGSE